MRKLLLIVVYFLLWNQAMMLPNSLAHSDVEKARFVSATGADANNCDNRFRPCKTITYAVTRANKGDKILVAQGSYRVDSSESIVYLLAETHPVYGGYNVTDNYQNQSPDKFVSTLVGIPKQHAEALYNKGFHVITDTKDSDISAAKQVNQVKQGLASIELTQSAQTASDCENGLAAGFTCNKVSLLGRLPLSALPTNSQFASDIWGHVDLNDMREYAIIGLQKGLAIVDVSNPEDPKVVGSVAGQSTTWRDIKVLQYYDAPTRRFKAYAYSGGDNISEGLSIIDLSMLPNSIRLVSRNKIDAQSHNIYISNVNYTTNTALNGQMPLLHVTGSGNFGGAWRTYTLNTPNAPATAYTNNSAGRSDYTHDASSLLISDTRAQTDCLLSTGDSCNVIIDFNESEVRLWQHNNPNEASQLSQFSYPNVDYVHSGWWSEDKNYIFVHDELDERNAVLNTTLNVFDISNLRAPQLVETWRGSTRAIDHNGFVKGNKYYMANYEKGVTILDVGDPTALIEIGNLDTYKASNNASFNGVWGVYPFLPSGHILASDIQGGLFVLKDETLTGTQDAAGFSSTHVSVQEGSKLNLEVFKQGQGDLSVDYQILYGSVSSSDINASSGTLQWSANETQSKFIEIDINSDSLEEFDELVIVVLNNPKNGDIVNAKSHAFIEIEGTLANTGQVSFEHDAASVLETQTTVVFTVNRVGGTEQAISANVTLQSGTAINTEDFAFTSGASLEELHWEDGDASSRTISIDIINDSQFEDLEQFTVLLASITPEVIGEIAQIMVSVKDDESNTAPSVNAGADTQINTRQTYILPGANAVDSSGEVSLNWSQTAGPSVTITNANMLRASFVAPQTATTITLELTATDEFGLSATDTVNITIVAPVQVAANNLGSSSGGSMGFILLSIWLLVVCKHVQAIQRVKKLMAGW